MAKADVSNYLLHQSMEVVVSKEATDKLGIDDIVKAVSPGKGWTLTSYSGGGSEVILRFINGEVATKNGEGPGYY